MENNIKIITEINRIIERLNNYEKLLEELEEKFSDNDGYVDVKVYNYPEIEGTHAPFYGKSMITLVKSEIKACNQYIESQIKLIDNR